MRIRVTRMHKDRYLITAHAYAFTFTKVEEINA